jgi:hypothetical protein
MEGQTTRFSEQSSKEPQIQKGSILIYRVFDIAEEVDLIEVERILAQETGKSRLRLALRSRNAIIMRNAPIRLMLGETDVHIGQERFRADMVGTIWDYGVLSIVFQLQIKPGTAWDELNSKAILMNRDGATVEIDTIATQKSQEIVELLKTAIKKPNSWKVFEDYVIFFLEQISGIDRASELKEKVDLPALILGEPQGSLASRSSGGILENLYQYASNDLVLLDWNSAIVLEPSGERDIADVLEFALTHLLEVRYYDDLLDRRLTTLYNAVEMRRQRIWQSRFSAISKDANTRFLEFSEFIERIDNSLKVVGDFYLAVIFRGALRRFRVADWQQSITRKMNLLAQVSQILQGEVNVNRGHWLEIIIIFLIAFELLSAVVKVKS